MSVDKSNMSPDKNINPLYMATSQSENSILNQLNSSTQKISHQNFNDKSRPIVVLNRISNQEIKAEITDISTSEEAKYSLYSPKRIGILNNLKNTTLFNMINCDEKIIFCIDISEELESSSIINGSLVDFVKRFLSFFLAIRKLIKNTDEFAIILLTDEVIWLCDFTNEVSNLIKSIDEINICNPTECDLNTIFDFLDKRKTASNPTVLINNAPNYIHRIILLYGRSDTIPRLNIEKYGDLLRHDTIFFDVIFIHKPLNAENFDKINEIYCQLCELDQRGCSYIFNVSEDSSKFHEYLAKITAHPLQRPRQSLSDRLSDEENID